MFRRRLKVLVFLVLLTAAAGCVRRQAVPTKYEKDGLSFTYFSDWRIKADKLVAEGQARVLTIEGPENAVMTVSRLSAGNTISIDEYAQILEEKRSEAVKREFGGVLPISTERTHTEPTVGRVAGETRSGLTQVFSVRLLGIDVPHMTNLFMVEQSGRKWIFMAQAPSANWIKVQSGFQKIFDSVAFAPESEEHGKN
jgi:hypothetical protein